MFHRGAHWNADVAAARMSRGEQRGMRAATPLGMTEQETLEELVRAARDVIDPETGLNILDMGLVFHIGYTAGTRIAHVVMTFTTPSCPSGGVMVDGIERRFADVEGVGSVKVDVTFETRWTPERITPEGREALGWR